MAGARFPLAAMAMATLALLALLVLPAGPACAGSTKISTWNLDWLTLRPTGDAALPEDVVRREAGDFDRLRWYAGVLGADVVAVEEVDGPQPLARLFPPPAYQLLFTQDRVVQRVGLAVRRGIAVTQNPDLTALDVYGPGARHRLRSGLDATLRFADGTSLRLLAIHLKTGCWRMDLGARKRACRTLARQIPVLLGWIAARRQEKMPFAVLGDFNRDLAPDDPVAAAFRDAGLVQPDAGKASPCWGGENFIDHVLLGGAAAGWLVPHSLRVLVYHETDPAMRDELSDHCPVSILLQPRH